MIEAISSRSDEFIELNSGEKIDPCGLEDYYSKAAPVKEMCILTVSGMNNASKSNVLWAIIQPDLDDFREFGEVNLRSVLKERFDNASQSLPSFKRLIGFTVTLEELPLTTLGKLNRNEIRRIYEPRVKAGKEGSLPVIGKPSDEDLLLVGSVVAQRILLCLKKLSDIRRPIIPEDSLELDLGIDSLGRIELTSSLKSAFSADLKVETISLAFSVKDLIIGITDALRGAKDLPHEDHGGLEGEDYWKEHLGILPKEETMQMLELTTGYFAWLFRFVLTAIDCLFFKIFFNIKAEGAQHVPKEGAYILYGNHTSFLDGPAIGACLPRRPVFQIFYFVFGPYFFRPFTRNRLLRNLVKMGRFIPFDFSTHFLEALRSCYYVLNHGKGLCFFPEGLRSASGEIGEFKKGFGVLAKVTGAMLVPVAITGAHEAWSSTSKYPKRHSIRVRFGKPFLPQDLEKEGLTMGTKDPYEAICLAARKALMELKKEG